MVLYKYLMIPLIIALSLSLSGGGEGPTGGVAPPEAPASGSQTAEEPERAAPVAVRDAKEEDMEEGACWQYIADEDGAALVITPDAAVHSFKFVSVHAEEGPRYVIQYVIDEELYSIEELTPDKPFFVKMLPAGLLPNYGVVFEDESGREQFYTLNVKGTGPEESYPYYLSEVR